MAYYVVVHVTPTTDSWIPDYLTTVTPLVAKHGGRYLARTQSHDHLEGEGPTPGLIAILEWPSKEAAQAFYTDPAYQPSLQARLSGAVNELFLIEGRDDFA